jgi:hypothetical protein
VKERVADLKNGHSALKKGSKAWLGLFML